MNKRQYKKYAKKNWCKSWYMSRYVDISNEMREYAIVFLDESPIGLYIEITDSKRGNLKHPLQIEIMKFGMIIGPSFSNRQISSLEPLQKSNIVVIPYKLGKSIVPILRYKYCDDK